MTIFHSQIKQSKIKRTHSDMAQNVDTLRPDNNIEVKYKS